MLLKPQYANIIWYSYTDVTTVLTDLPQNKMVTFFQTIFAGVFLWIKSFVFRFDCH